MPTVYDVLRSEGGNQVSPLTTNPDLGQFVVGVIQHLTLLAAAKGVGPSDVAISDPYIEGTAICAVVRWDGVIRLGGHPPDPLRSRGSFADFLAQEQGAYADFFQHNASIRRFVGKVLEVLTAYANHRHVPLTSIRLEQPHVAHDQYVRAFLAVTTTAPN